MQSVFKMYTHMLYHLSMGPLKPEHTGNNRFFLFSSILCIQNRTPNESFLMI